MVPAKYMNSAGFYCLLPPTNEVWGEVMFLQLSVCPKGEGVCLGGYAYKGLHLGGRVSASRGVCIQGVGLPPQLEKWAYASYWNAFLLTMRNLYFYLCKFTWNISTLFMDKQQLSSVSRKRWPSFFCFYKQQECIPVGCVSSAAVAVSLVDRILDTRLWKHYLSATTVADGKNAIPWRSKDHISFSQKCTVNQIVV